MLFVADYYNLRYLIREAGSVTIDQLVAFFSDSIEPKRLRFWVKRLADMGEIDIDQKSGVVTTHSRAELQEDLKRQRIRAFWIVTWFRSRLLHDIIQLRPPFAYEVILKIARNGNKELMDLMLEEEEESNMPEEGEVVRRDTEGVDYEIYDIAVCTTALQATAAARAIRQNAIPGVKDDVVHLVVVPDEETGKQMEPYGFDSYVILKKVYSEEVELEILEPEFRTWEDA